MRSGTERDAIPRSGAAGLALKRGDGLLVRLSPGPTVPELLDDEIAAELARLKRHRDLSLMTLCLTGAEATVVIAAFLHRRALVGPRTVLAALTIAARLSDRSVGLWQRIRPAPAPLP